MGKNKNLDFVVFKISAQFKNPFLEKRDTKNKILTKFSILNTTTSALTNSDKVL